MNLYTRRRLANGIALLAACAAAAFGLLFLGWILWTLLAKGLAGVDWGLSLVTPVIVKYRDEKTDTRTELEQWIR